LGTSVLTPGAELDLSGLGAVQGHDRLSPKRTAMSSGTRMAEVVLEACPASSRVCPCLPKLSRIES
jgi:hypothetical protein